MNFFRLSERALLRAGVIAVSAGISACASSAPGTIGAALGQQTDHRLFVRSMPPGQGASRAGLAVDDEILLIDGRDVRAMTQEDVRRAVRGDVGSTMVVTVLRGTEKLEIKVVRTPLLAEKGSK
jgi:C-terminal processing protease CtpA/Prc